MREKTTFFFKHLLKFETFFLPNAFFLYFAAFLKLIGVIHITHSLDVILFSNQVFPLQQYYNKITLVSQSTYHSILDDYWYDVLSFAIYILVPLPWIIFYVTYRVQLTSSYKPAKKTKMLLRVSSLLNTIVLFFSQHIIEALSVIIFSIINEPVLISELKLSRTNMLYSYRKYFYLVMNSLYIIFVNIINYWQIALLNQPFFSSKITIQIYQNKLFQIILCLLFNSQAIALCHLFFPTNHLMKLIINSAISGVLILFYCSYAQSFFSQQTFLSKLFIIVINMCFLSSLLEVYVYLKKANGLTLAEFIEKVLIELVFALIINQCLFSLIIKHLRYNMKKRLFNHQKIISIEPLLYSATVLMQSIEDNNKIYALLQMIQEHKKECKDQGCQCTKAEFLIHYAKIANEKTEVTNKLSIEQFYLVYKEIIICFENEISNVLDTVTKMNKLVEYCQVIILLIEFICFFSQNVFFACFMIEKFLKKMKKPPFILKYQMYQLKQRTIQSYKNKLFEYFHRFEKTHSKEMMVFSHFFKYQQVIWSIRRNLSQLSSEFLNVFSLKYLKNSISASSLCNINDIIKNCKRYRNQNALLKSSILRNFSFFDKLLNEELCYLLTLYFSTICNKVPKYIQRCISKDYGSVNCIQHMNQSYNEKGMNHPIIIFVEEGKKFVIRYMCKYLMAILGFESNELIGKEVSELLPKAFEEAHLTVISNNVFRKKPRYFENNVFCIDKRGFHIPINISVGFFPTIDNNIIIILNAVKRDYSDKYSFIVTDEYGTFLCYSKALESNFIINKEIISKVKFNFFSYFNMPESTFDPLRKALAKVRDSSNKRESALVRNAMAKFENDTKTNIKVKEIKDLNFLYDKQKLRVSSEKIKNWIKESQTDLSLLAQIERQESLFDIYQSTSSFRDNFELIAKCKKQLVGMQIKVASIHRSTFFYITLFEIDKSTRDFVNKTINNCSVISSSINKRDDHRGRLSPSKKYSQKTIGPQSPTNKRKRLSIISKLLKNPTYNKEGDGIKMDNSFNNSTNQSNLNFSVSFNKSLITKENSSQGQLNAKAASKREGKKESFLPFRFITSNSPNCYKAAVLKVIVVFDLVIIAFLSVFFFPLTESIIDVIESYCLIGYLNELLQYLLGSASLLAINTCLVFPGMPNGQLVIDNELITQNLQAKSKELLSSLNQFHSSLYTLNAYNLIDIANDNYTILKKNWSTSSRQSNIFEELLSFHYYLDAGSKTETKLASCHLEAFKFRQFANDPQGLSFEPTRDDILIYYILENVLFKLLPQLHTIYFNINAKTSGFFNRFEVSIIIYSVCFMGVFGIIVTVLYCLFALLMNSNLNMTQELLNEKNDYVVVNRLSMFKALMSDFKYSRCEEYEKSLKESITTTKMLYRVADSEAVAFLNNSLNDSLNSATGQIPILVVTKPNQLVSTVNNVTTSEIMNDNPKEIASFRKSQVLHKKKRTIKSTASPQSGIDTQANSIKEKEESILTLLKKNDKCTLAFRSYVLFSVLLNVGALLVFLFLNLQQSKRLQMSSAISSNHIALISSYNYLTLIYFSNVLYFDPYRFELKEDLMKVKDNWYDIQPDFNNSIYLSLKDTLYSSTLLMLEIIDGNVNAFIAKELSLMKELRALDLIFNSNDYCLMSSVAFQLYDYKGDSLMEMVALTNQNAKDCLAIGNNINKNGLTTAMSTYLLELNSIYKNFIVDHEADRKDKFDYYFFMPRPLLHSMFNVLLQGDEAQQLMIATLRKETDLLINAWRQCEGDFIAAFIFFDMLFSCVSLWFLIKINQDHNILLRTAKKISRAIGY